MLKMIKKKEMEYFILLVEINLKVIVKMIKQKEKELYIIVMGLKKKVIG